MIFYTEKKIIEGFRKNDNVFLEKFYKKHYPMIKTLVNNNKGNDYDAKDIYQEAFIIIYNLIKKNEFYLSCSFKTYLYSICRNLWLGQLYKKKIRKEEFIDNERFITIENEIDVDLEYILNFKYKIFKRNFDKLEDECRQILILFLKKMSFKEIANIMGYKNESQARKRKFRCKLSLLKNIKNDQAYLELIKDGK